MMPAYDVENTQGSRMEMEEEAGALFSRTRAMGTAFEDLCAAFLTHDL